MKGTIYVYCPKLTQIMNDCLKKIFFLIYILKNADIYVYFKKENKGEKENYRPICILSNFSKVFERLIHNKLDEFMEIKFSNFSLAFERTIIHNTHH